MSALTFLSWQTVVPRIGPGIVPAMSLPIFPSIIALQRRIS